MAATKKAPKKRTPKKEKELKPILEALEVPAVRASIADSARVADLHFARLIHDGQEQVDAYQKAYNPTTDRISSLSSMASRKTRSQNVLRELDRLRRQDEDEANNQDKLEEILLDGSRLKMEMLKTVYLLATNPDTQDAVRLKAALELGNLKHVDAFVRTGSTFNIDNSKTQNNVIVSEGKTAGELRAGIMEYLGRIAPAPVALPAPLPDEDDVLEAEVLPD